MIAGAGLTAPVAYRWKCQINENAKLPAFASALPEADHNEICGWAAARELGPFSAVLLEDPDAHPRDVLRIELTAALASAGARVVERVPARGETPLERLVSLVLLGDLVSLYLAVLRGRRPGHDRALGHAEGAAGRASERSAGRSTVSVMSRPSPLRAPPIASIDRRRGRAPTRPAAG